MPGGLAGKASGEEKTRRPREDGGDGPPNPAGVDCGDGGGGGGDGGGGGGRRHDVASRFFGIEGGGGRNVEPGLAVGPTSLAGGAVMPAGRVFSGSSAVDLEDWVAQERLQWAPVA